MVKEQDLMYVVILLPEYEVWYTKNPYILYEELIEDLALGVDITSIRDLLFVEDLFFLF